MDELRQEIMGIERILQALLKLSESGSRAEIERLKVELERSDLGSELVGVVRQLRQLDVVSDDG